MPIHKELLSTLFLVEPKVTVKLTTALSLSRAPRKASRAVPGWVSLEMSLYIEEEQGHVQCNVTFTSVRQPHPYKMTSF